MVKRQRGFTLVEVMIVIAILGVLAGIAAPNAVEWISSQRVRDTAADLHTSFLKAKSEATARGLTTTVAPVGGDWSNGWTIPNPDSTYNPDPAAPTVFIYQQGALSNVTVTRVSGATNVVFSTIGRLQGLPVALQITAQGTALTRCVTVDLMGRPKIINGSC